MSVRAAPGRHRGDPATTRVVALATHPIQYQAPWFRALSSRAGIELEVLFEHLPDARAQGEGFGRAFQWDVPLLDGYRWRDLDAPPGPRSLPTALRALASALDETCPDQLLLTGWHSPLLALAPTLAARTGLPCLVRGESNALKPRAPWTRAVHRALLRRYRAFLVIGSANRAFYLDHGVAAQSLFDCPYFVDNARFVEQAGRSASRRDALRARFGVRPRDVCFVFAGKFERKKRVLDAIEAMRALRDRPAHLLLVGSGALQDEARRRAAGLAVSFAGFLNQREISDAYAAGDCLVLPSDHGETWGLVVNEAMASGLPAIVSDRVGCGPDLVEHGRTGWIHRCGDVASLVSSMRAAVDARERLAAMGDAARARVLGEFGVERAAQATESAVRWIASAPAQRVAA